MITAANLPKRAFLAVISAFLLLLCYSCGKPEKDGLISVALDHDDINWESISTENFKLYAPEGSYAAANLEELAEKSETARQLVMERLQVVKQEKSPKLLFLESPEAMQELSGIAAGGRAIVGENGIFFLYREAGNPPLQHEMGHLYSWRSWGEPAAYWLSEGVAVYAAGDCAGEDLHAWAAKLAVENRLTDFAELEREFDFSKAEPHLQAGSFVKYIMEKYGVRSFRMLWEKGLSASSEATGLEMDALLENWTAHVMQNEFTAVAQFLELDGKIGCE